MNDGLFCYLMVKKGKTWDAASDYCKTLGGDLVSISDKEENGFVQSELLVDFISYLL